MKLLYAFSAVLFTTKTTWACDDLELNRLWSDGSLKESRDLLIDSFFAQCKTSPNLCEYIEEDDASNLIETYSRIIDYRALKSELEYSSLEAACLAQEGSYEIIYVDFELFNLQEPLDGLDGFRLININRPYCLPSSCSNDLNDLEEALFAFEDSSWANFTVDHIFFDRDTEPSSDSTQICNIEDAKREAFGDPVRLAWNSYFDRVDADCIHDSWEDNAWYCSTLYRSYGELDILTQRWYNFYTSQEFVNFKQSCEAAGGELNPFDMIFTFQLSTDEQDLDRIDANYFFQGYIECFPSTCTHEEKKEIVDQRHLVSFLEALVEKNNAASTVRRMLSTRKYVRRETRASFAAANQLFLRRIQNEDLGEQSPQVQPPKESKYNSRESVLDLFKIDKSKAVSEAFPASEIYKGNNDPQSRSYNFLEGADCGEFDYCYTRVTNFDLRSIEGTQDDEGDAGTDSVVGAEGEASNPVISVPFFSSP